MMPPLPRSALALALGLGAGALAHALGLPLPWMLGPMIGLTILAVAGAPVAAPLALRPVVIPAIGVMLGSGLTPEVAAGLARWSATLVLLVPVLCAMAGVAYLIFRRIGRADPVTAFFCAMPGGLNDMIIMGAAAGGDERRIALSHATRILIVVVVIVAFFAVGLGVRSPGQGAAWVALEDLSPRDWAVLLACGALGAPLGKWLRLPAGQMLGPMLLSAVAHLSGLVLVAPPSLIIVAAQVSLGTIIGCRFAGVPPREVASHMALGALAALAMLAVALPGAWAIEQTSGVPLSQAVLAMAPGGLTEMSLLALALHQEVAYVATMHMVRIVLVIGLAPLGFARFRR